MYLWVFSLRKLNAQITTTPDNHALALVTAYILSGVIPFMWGPASKETCAPRDQRPDVGRSR